MKNFIKKLLILSALLNITKITEASFDILLKKTIKNIKKNYLENNNLNKKKLKKLISQKANYYFTNYSSIIEKIDITNKKVVYCTDIHESNIKPYFLKTLISNNYLNEFDLSKNYYKLNQNCILVFGGDYVDKSNKNNAYTVLELILQLKNQNPSNVFLLRGNHENFNRTNDKHAFMQLNYKPHDYNQYTSGKHLHKKDHKNINKLYNLMPTALFLENNANNKKQYCMVSHAAIEPLFIEDIKNFLTENTNLKILDSILKKNKNYKKTNGFFWGEYQLNSTNKWERLEPNVFITENSYKEILENINKNSNFELLATLSGHQHGGGYNNPLIQELNLNKNCNYISYFSDKNNKTNKNSKVYNIIEKNSLIKGTPCFYGNQFEQMFKNKKLKFLEISINSKSQYIKREI